MEGIWVLVQVFLRNWKDKGTKTQFAKKMKTSRSAVDRLLDPKRTCSLKSLVTAVSVLGKNLEVKMI